MLKTPSILLKIRQLSTFSRSFGATRVIFNRPPQSAEASIEVDPAGLSPNVVHVEAEPVGPGAGKGTDYKNPEYFCYKTMSFHEAEVELLKYRCPQPSNKN